MDVKITPLDFLESVYSKSQAERKRKYEQFCSSYNELSPELREALAEIEDKGCYRIPDFLDKGLLARVSSRFEDFLQTGENLRMPRDLRGNSEGAMYADLPRLSIDQLSQGVDSYKDITDNVQMRDPLIQVPEILDIALCNDFLDLASVYLDSFPAFTYAKLLRNFANDMQDFDTQYFHVDEITPKLLKVFVYFNDVDLDGGPFTYVTDSHKEKEKYWGGFRFSVEDVEADFSKGHISYCVAKVGDVVIADTTGLHKGLKPKLKDRTVLILNYLVHQEYSYNYKPDIQANIKQADFDRLTPKQKAACDLLNVVS